MNGKANFGEKFKKNGQPCLVIKTFEVKKATAARFIIRYNVDSISCQN
jgi:hypothetical protein